MERTNLRRSNSIHNRVDPGNEPAAPPARTTSSSTAKNKESSSKISENLLPAKERVLDAMVGTSPPVATVEQEEKKEEAASTSNFSAKERAMDSLFASSAQPTSGEIDVPLSSASRGEAGSAKAGSKKRTKDSRAASTGQQGDENIVLEVASPSEFGAQQPGAVLVRGESAGPPARPEAESDSGDLSHTVEDESGEAHVEAHFDYSVHHHVSAVAVDEGEFEETVRRRILQGAARASVVDLTETKLDRQRMLCYWVIPIVVLLGIIIGLAVGLTRGSGENEEPKNDSCDTVQAKNLLMQCQCFGSIKAESPGTSEEYANLTAALDINATEGDEFACDTQNVALWWLANDTEHRSLAGLPRLERSRLEQRLVLAMLYISTNGTNWVDQGFWMSLEDECEWPGVGCTSTQIVNQLDLTERNLEGPIPTEILGLSEITVLRLGKNQISGTLPQELFNEFGLLQHLDVSFNNIAGQIPHAVNVEDLFQFLVGFISTNPNITLEQLLQNPTLVGIERTLFTLNFANNMFTGTFPQGIELLSTLRELRFDNNNVGKGGIYLDDLIIAAGVLDAVPTDALGFSELEHFSASNNPDFDFTLHGFGTFRLYTDLEYVDASNTSAYAAIPSEIGTFIELEELKISNTKVTGTVPTEILNCVQLQTLELANTLITGTLPEGICDTLPFVGAPLVSCNSSLVINCSCCQCV